MPIVGDWLNGRALAWGARDSGFDSRLPDSISMIWILFILLAQPAKAAAAAGGVKESSSTNSAGSLSYDDGSFAPESEGIGHSSQASDHLLKIRDSSFESLNRFFEDLRSKRESQDQRRAAALPGTSPVPHPPLPPRPPPPDREAPPRERLPRTCEPCPMPPAPQYHKVPPSRKHFPCEGDHVHTWVMHQGPPPACICRPKDDVECL